MVEFQFSWWEVAAVALILTGIFIVSTQGGRINYK